MANLFDVYKVFRPGTTILSDDFNSFQSALVGAFQKLGTTRADNLTGVEEPFSVGTPTAATHAVRKDYYESSVDALSAAAVAGELASQVAAADGSATDSANSATASASSAADSLGYYQAAQALDTIMPSGTTNSTMRYNGSNWAETDKLQIDSAGVVTATAGLRSTGAGAGSFRAGSSAGATTQGVNAVAVGESAGNTGQLDGAVAVGYCSGCDTQGSFSVALGYNAGTTAMGLQSVAIGNNAGHTGQGNNGIIISSKGIAVDDSTDGHIHIASDEASLDYTNADGWSATDTVGSFALRVDGWLAQFPAGRPIFIVGTGQSNSTGRGPNVSVTTNTNVKDWASDGSGGAQTWRTPNTETATVKADYSAAADYIGYKEGQFGNIHISMANFIAQRSGRTVYVLQVGRDGAPSTYWNPATQPAGQATYTTLKNAMTAVLATTELTTWNIDKPDILNIMQGESDAGGLLALSPTSPTLSGDTWGDNWLSYMKNASTNWFAENHTRVFVYDVSDTANWGPTSQANAPWRWNGVSALVEKGGNFFEYVNSVGIPVGAGVEEVHFSGVGSNLQGEIGAKIALGEISSPNPVNNGWDIVDGTAPAGMPYTLKNQNRTAYQSDGITVSRVAGNVEIDATETKITTVSGTLEADIAVTTGDRNSIVATDALGNLKRGTPTYTGVKVWTGTTVATPSASNSIVIGTFPMLYTDTERWTGIATLESLEINPSGYSTPSITAQWTLNIFPVNAFGVLQIISATLGLPFGHDPAQGAHNPQSPPMLSIAAGGTLANGLQLTVTGQINSGTTKHRLTYVYNDISGI